MLSIHVILLAMLAIIVIILVLIMRKHHSSDEIMITFGGVPSSVELYRAGYSAALLRRFMRESSQDDLDSLIVELLGEGEEG